MFYYEKALVVLEGHIVTDKTQSGKEGGCLRTPFLKLCTFWLPTLKHFQLFKKGPAQFSKWYGHQV